MHTLSRKYPKSIRTRSGPFTSGSWVKTRLTVRSIVRLCFVPGTKDITGKARSILLEKGSPTPMAPYLRKARSRDLALQPNGAGSVKTVHLCRTRTRLNGSWKGSLNVLKNLCDMSLVLKHFLPEREVRADRLHPRHRELSQMHHRH